MRTCLRNKIIDLQPFFVKTLGHYCPNFKIQNVNVGSGD